jgi:hypothetical protein
VGEVCLTHGEQAVWQTVEKPVISGRYHRAAASPEWMCTTFEVWNLEIELIERHSRFEERVRVLVREFVICHGSARDPHYNAAVAWSN